MELVPFNTASDHRCPAFSTQVSDPGSTSYRGPWANYMPSASFMLTCAPWARSLRPHLLRGGLWGDLPQPFSLQSQCGNEKLKDDQNADRNGCVHNKGKAQQIGEDELEIGNH